MRVSHSATGSKSSSPGRCHNALSPALSSNCRPGGQSVFTRESNLGFNPNSPRRGGIGPLSDHEARNLVEQPFSLLGFRFEPLVVDKILSYTNRHPSLNPVLLSRTHSVLQAEQPEREPTIHNWDRRGR